MNQNNLKHIKLDLFTSLAEIGMKNTENEHWEGWKYEYWSCKLTSTIKYVMLVATKKYLQNMYS